MQPLEGVRVLDISRMVAGPTTGMLLADMGADVVKIEPPTGDDARYMNWRYTPDAAPFFIAANRNKRGIVLDLRDEAGLAAFDRLVADADVLIHNYPGGLADKIGVGYERLSGINPRLVHCAISGFGERGPWSSRLGIDSLVQAMGGMMSVTGEPDGPPLRVGAPVVDSAAGASAVAAICAALFARERSGHGDAVSVSLLAQATFMQGPLFAYAQDTGANPPRMGNRSPLALIIEGRASDGTLLVGIPTDKFWKRFCAAIGAPELADHELLQSQRDRIGQQDLIAELVADPIAAQPVDHWLEVFGEARLPTAPLLDYAQVVAHPHVQAAELFLEVDIGDGDLRRTPGAPWALASAPVEARDAPPALGEDTTEVLREAGFTAEEIDDLERRGVTRGSFNDLWG